MSQANPCNEYLGAKKIKWFGPEWEGAPMTRSCQQVAVPIGELCVHCNQAILAGDSGLVYANGPAAHRGCFMENVGL